ncbi:MAG: siphovirus Gp157 family protein [Clostridia bacterium]|nr:siphovirus Gp157 family protein [Clostridia bacterium]
MKLYEINDAIETLLSALTVDPETGEVPADADDVIAQIDALSMERTAVLEYLAKEVLNLRADQAAVKAEEARLKERRERMEKREAAILGVLDRECAGQKTDLGVATVSYRATEATEITDEDEAVRYLIDNNYLDAVRVTPAVYHVEKAEAKRLIRSGVEVPGVTVSRTNRCSLK